MEGADLKLSVRRSVRRAVALLVLLAFALQAYVALTRWRKGHVALPPNVGNFPAVVGQLERPKADAPFSFAVLGDIQRGTATFAAIMDRLKRLPLSFLVILGDFSTSAREGDHAHFRATAAKELQTRFPVFLVAGSHDTNYKPKPETTQHRLTLRDFELAYGPSQFYFAFRGDLFVVLRALPGPGRAAAAFLRQVLEAERARARRVFVFMHVPPSVCWFTQCAYAEGTAELVSLFEQHRVDYVCTGDFHGFASAKHKHTTYIVSGGGGARLERSELGAFHHAMVLRVSPDRVEQGVLHVRRRLGLGRRSERLALGALYPFLRTHWKATVALDLLLACLFAWLCRMPTRLARTRDAGTG